MHFNVHIHSFNSKWNRPECRMKLNIAESRQIQRRSTELTTSSQAKSQFSVDHYCKCNRHRIQIAASNKTSFIQMLCVVAGLHLSHGWFFCLILSFIPFPRTVACSNTIPVLFCFVRWFTSTTITLVALVILHIRSFAYSERKRKSASCIWYRTIKCIGVEASQ